MSMISPETYVAQCEGMSYEELLSIRDELMQSIWRFEKNDESNNEYQPSPKTIYQVHLEYLGKLCELIADKYRDMQWQ